MATTPIDYYSTIAESLGISTTLTIILISIISIWTLIWKGFGLWKASKKNHIVWFVIFLVFNTLGILEILYLFIFSKMSLKKNKSTESVKEKTKVNKNKK
jgi:hypothetical protein